MRRRSSKWIPSLGFAALFGFATPSISSAAPDPSGFEDLSAEQQAELRKAAELIAQGKDRDDPEVLKHVNAAAAYGQAAEAAAKNEGLAGELERLRAQIERDKARAERDREMYDKPSVWEQAGAQLLQALIGMLMDVGKQKLNDWVNGGGEDDQLLDQIRELEEERTRLEEELAGGGVNGPGGPGNNGGLGEVITDANGNTGYDTDGNGFVDIPLYPGGSPGSPGNDGTNPVLTTPGSVLPGGPLSTDSPSSLDKDDSAADSVPASVGGGGIGGIGGPGAGGPGFGGAAGTPSVGGGGLAPGAAGADGPGSEEDPDAAGLAGAGGAEGGEAGELDGAEGDEGALGKSGSGADGEDGAAPGTKKAFGRVIVLPKLEFEDLAGNRKANDDWSEEWKDDSWDDSADNGDFDEDWSNDDDWGGEWDAAAKKGKKKSSGDVETTTAEDQETAELVDQIIRVETAVAEWRQLEAKAKQAGVDPYGFKDEMGYRASGGAEHDPFKDVRTKEGKIDLTKVDVWLISEETWRDGEEPVRYKLAIDPDDITDFEPIHGGVAMVQGVVKEVEVDKRVMEEIKGDVQEIQVERVLLSAEKPPAEGDDLSEDGDPFSEDSETPAPLPADGSEPKKGLDTPAPKPLPEKSDAPKEGGSDDEDDWGSW